MRRTPRSIHKRFALAMGLVLGTTFLMEFLLMIALGELTLANLDLRLESLLDASMLTVLSAPVIWWSIRQLAMTSTSLHLQESALRAAVNAVVITDRKGRVVWSNPAFTRLTGYEPEEVRGRNLRFLKSGRQGDEQYRDLWGTILSGRVWNGEMRNRRKDGSLYHEEQQITPIRGEDGAIEHFVSVKQDITSRVASAEALRRSEARFRSIVDSDMIGILFWDPDGRIVDANDAFLHLIGYDRAHLLAGAFRSIELTPPEFAEMDRKAFAEIERDGVCRPYEKEYFHRDGKRIPVLVGGARMSRESQEGVRFVVDRTQHQALERELKVATLQFQQAQKMEAVGRLAGGVAHDFNNLLTVIAGYTELVRVTLAQDDKRRGQMEQIGLAASRAAGLTRQLLAFSRKQVLQPEVLDLNEVLASAEKMLRRLIGEDIDFSVVLAAGLGRVLADRGQLEQVMLNLCINARDAMPEGGSLSVETANRILDEEFVRTRRGLRPGPHVVMSVADSGTGMTEEVMKCVFEPFFTTKEEGKGTGLGLATVYGIVTQSGGGIWVESCPGKGTTFWIYLPVTEEASPRAPSPERQAPPAIGAETILLVEDEAAVATLAQSILQGAGYKVLRASQGKDAMAAAESNHDVIQLLLTDIVMPGFSGRVLADRLTALRPRIRVLFMSGYTAEVIPLELNPGTHLLQKPFSPDELLRKVREVLGAPPSPPHEAPEVPGGP